MSSSDQKKTPEKASTPKSSETSDTTNSSDRRATAQNTITSSNSNTSDTTTTTTTTTTISDLPLRQENDDGGPIAQQIGRLNLNTRQRAPPMLNLSNQANAGRADDGGHQPRRRGQTSDASSSSPDSDEEFKQHMQRQAELFGLPSLSSEERKKIKEALDGGGEELEWLEEDSIRRYIEEQERIDREAEKKRKEGDGEGK